MPLLTLARLKHMVSAWMAAEAAMLVVATFTAQAPCKPNAYRSCLNVPAGLLDLQEQQMRDRRWQNVPLPGDFPTQKQCTGLTAQ